MSSRTDILTRIRSSLNTAYLPAASGATSPAPVPPTFEEPLLDVFIEALLAVQGVIHVVADVDAARDLLLSEFRTRGVVQVLCWDPGRLSVPDLEGTLAHHGIELVKSGLSGADRQQEIQRLSAIEIGLTGADVGLARTGSVVLHADSAQGRLASLMPPVHYVLLRSDQIYPDLAAWITSDGADEAIAGSSNTVIITGPSRTGDIAQTLTLGAHGPKELHVILQLGPASA